MLKLLFFYCLLFSSLFSSAFAEERLLPENGSQIQLSFAPLVKQVSPAVVNIYTKRVVTSRVSPFRGDPFFEQFFGGALGGGIPRQRVESSLGSGAIVDASGLVVTNAHVIKGADEITVGLPDGREFAAKKVVVDEPSDLAVLKIDPDGEALPAVSLKPSENLEVGDLVLAIGNPFGVGQTVTSGIVSAQARSSLNINDFNFFIQTDAAINPGNSGGPLVAMDGGVVGINSAIYSRDGGSLGIGFAIPSEMVATVVAAAENGQVSDKGIARPWLGVTVQKVTSDIAESLELSTPRGVLIADLHMASPLRQAKRISPRKKSVAGRQGLNIGDLIISFNGKDIYDPAEMKFRMAMVPLGGKARIDIMRQDQLFTYEFEAVVPPDVPPRDQRTLEGNHPLNGAQVANVNPAVASELGIRDEEGVVVMAVSGRTQAARVAAPGDIIVSVNGAAIQNVRDLERALRDNRAAAWNLILSRDGRQRQVILR